MTLDDQQRAVLVALQHPIRLELHERLLEDGGKPQSVDALAGKVKHNHRGVRTHLRALAHAGLAHSFGPGDTMWVATAQQIRVPEVAEMNPDDPDRNLVAGLWRMITERRAQRLTSWARNATDPRWSAWIDASIGQEGVMLLTPGQASELEQRLLETLRDFRRARQAADGEMLVWIEITAAPIAAVTDETRRR